MTVEELTQKSTDLTAQSIDLQTQIQSLQDMQHQVLLCRDECNRLLSVTQSGELPIDPPQAEQIAATLLAVKQSVQPVPVQPLGKQ